MTQLVKRVPALTLCLLLSQGALPAFAVDVESATPPFDVATEIPKPPRVSFDELSPCDVATSPSRPSVLQIHPNLESLIKPQRDLRRAGAWATQPDTFAHLPDGGYVVLVDTELRVAFSLMFPDRNVSSEVPHMATHRSLLTFMEESTGGPVQILSSLELRKSDGRWIEASNQSNTYLRHRCDLQNDRAHLDFGLAIAARYGLRLAENARIRDLSWELKQELEKASKDPSSPLHPLNRDLPTPQETARIHLERAEAERLPLFFHGFPAYQALKVLHRALAERFPVLAAGRVQCDTHALLEALSHEEDEELCFTLVTLEGLINNDGPELAVMNTYQPGRIDRFVRFLKEARNRFQITELDPFFEEKNPLAVGRAGRDLLWLMQRTLYTHFPKKALAAGPTGKPSYEIDSTDVLQALPSPYLETLGDELRFLIAELNRAGVDATYEHYFKDRPAHLQKLARLIHDHLGKHVERELPSGWLEGPL